MQNISKLPVFIPACFLLFGVPVFLTATGIALVCWLGFRLYQRYRHQKIAAQLNIPVPHPVPRRTEQDLLLEAFGLMQNRISSYLKALYPEARWVWGTPNALKRISEGREAVIHLENAGGYHRARVIYDGFRFQSLQFVCYGLPEQAKSTPQEKPKSEIKPETDFSLLAFDWMNSRVEYLNALANEALARNDGCFFIEAAALPDTDGWADICKQLKEEFFDAEIEENQIKVTIQE